jgi:heme/copper-type cytochrome/quinol oxidase subunit 3
MLLALYFGLRSATFRADRQGGAEAISYYWHFVTIMWFGIFSTVYIIR